MQNNTVEWCNCSIQFIIMSLVFMQICLSSHIKIFNIHSTFKVDKNIFHPNVPPRFTIAKRRCTSEAKSNLKDHRKAYITNSIISSFPLRMLIDMRTIALIDLGIENSMLSLDFSPRQSNHIQRCWDDKTIKRK